MPRRKRAIAGRAQPRGAEARPERLQVRATEAEIAAWQELATARRSTVSDLVRRLLEREIDLQNQEDHMFGVGWTNPITSHEPVLERVDTRGLLPHHPMFSGEWIVLCLHCRFSSAGLSRHDAMRVAAQHQAMARISAGQPQATRPQTVDRLHALARSLAGDVARLRERARCRASGHAADEYNGRLECGCAERAALSDSAYETSHQTDDLAGILDRIRHLIGERDIAFSALVTTED